MCRGVGGGGLGVRGGGAEISKVRNSIPYESLDNVYLLAFFFSIRKKEETGNK